MAESCLVGVLKVFSAEGARVSSVWTNKVSARATPRCASGTSLFCSCVRIPQRPLAPCPKYFGSDQLIELLSQAAWFAMLRAQALAETQNTPLCGVPPFLSSTPKTISASKMELASN